MSASLSSVPKLQFFDANGNPLVGGKLYTYAAGTTTPLATYTDSSAGTPNTNPIILNSRGEANVWLSNTTYKFVLKTSADVEIWTVDNISNAINTSQILASGGSASDPPYTFATDNDTGMYLAAVGQLGLTVNGTPVLRSTSTVMIIGQSGGSNDVDVTLYGDLAQTGNVTQTGDVTQTGNYGLTGNLTVSGSQSASSYNGGQLAGQRNRIINGAMKLNQRSSSSYTITAAAALRYTLDRWYAYCTGANTSVTQFTSGAENRFRITGAASNTGVGIGQRIEAANSMDLAGKTCTLSCKLSSSSLTSITWTAYYANTADTFGTLASPTKTQIATGTFTITSTEASYNAQISVPAAATTGIEIVFTGGALLAAQTLTLGDVQFEAGSVATPFEVRLIASEELECQRYYQNSKTRGFAVGTTGNSVGQVWETIYASSTTSYTGVSIRFLRRMRTTPTMVLVDSGGGGSPNSVSVGLTTYTVSVTASDIGFQFSSIAATGLTTGTPATIYFDYSADAEL